MTLVRRGRRPCLFIDLLAVVAEISLCGLGSCYEILRGRGRGTAHSLQHYGVGGGVTANLLEVVVRQIFQDKNRGSG
eukprot:COSAG01_NODE_23_length_37704_cov_30.005877_47_plen_77_part_00